MPQEPKPQHCDYCGDYIGIYVKPYREPQSCGKAECERYAQKCDREEEAAREERAREDRYDRY